MLSGRMRRVPGGWPLGTGYGEVREQARRRRAIFSSCPLNNHSIKPEENECPWTNEDFWCCWSRTKRLHSYCKKSRSFHSPPPLFIYEMPLKRVREPSVRYLPWGFRKPRVLERRENPRVTVHRTYLNQQNSNSNLRAADCKNQTSADQE